MRLRDIEHNFGLNVARMVEGLSDSLAEDPSNKQAWQKRKQAYFKGCARNRLMFGSSRRPTSSITRERSSKTTGIIGPKVWDRFKRGRQEQIWYFDELLAIFKSSAANRIVEELERVVNELRHITVGEI